ncbi:hypothetical protein, partial [Bacillus altitudinis]|uniref:hypothetical protein n=1 Tax=Bacillus altitudinis TaxID=293387 RepID=UPI001C92E840
YRKTPTTKSSVCGPSQLYQPPKHVHHFQYTTTRHPSNYQQNLYLFTKLFSTTRSATAIDDQKTLYVLQTKIFN